MSEKALKYLERLQEKAYSHFGEPADLRARIMDYYKNQLLKIEEITKTTQSAQPPPTSFLLGNTLLTKYEDPMMYQILTELSRGIEEGLSKLNSNIFSLEDLKQKITVPSFGTLLTTEVNAMAIAVPKSTEYLVVFESDLFSFCLLLSKVISLFFPIDYEYDKLKSKKENIHTIYSIVNQNIDKKIKEDPRILTRFRALIFAHVLFGGLMYAKQYYIEDEYGPDAYSIRHPMELFILGHEYAHILGNHITHSSVVSANLVGEEVNERIYSWDHEFEADLNGLNFMLGAADMRNIDPVISFRGPTLFFDMIDIVERAKSIISTGDEGANVGIRRSHPPPLTRRNRLRQYIENTWGNSPYGEQLLEPSLAIDNIMEALWKSIVKDFRNFHNRDTI